MEHNRTLAAKRVRLEQRARIMQMIRAFFIERGYLEVETPHRVPMNAPEAHIDAVGSEGWFLQTSPELPMKRLLAAGYERLFQLCRCWRGGERGARHLPEFAMLEWYRGAADYHALMAECEELLRALVPSGRLNWRGHRVGLQRPWERITVGEAFARYTQTTPAAALQDCSFDERIAFEIEPHLGLERPTFLVEYPAECAALARRKTDDPKVAERFELYVAGIELANAFSELTDPDEQRSRFEEEEQCRRTAGKPPYPFPERFIAELGAIGSAAGIALGLDRLVMLLTDAQTIDEVVAFTPEDL